ncbi:MAG: hypothetical protein ABSD75_16535 [Terriglobales bacterium]
MQNWFSVDQLDVERLLGEWRWLCSKPMTLIARNAYAGLFLGDESGEIYQLDVAVGKLAKVADSEAQFHELTATPEKRNEWFAEVDEQASAARGLKPNATQCIGFSVPLAFAEGGSSNNTPYIVDLYEHVSFLGDLHRQIPGFPDGGKVRLVIAPKP